MRKWKRSARLVEMTHDLLIRPHKLIPLATFSERYRSAKSSISEDLSIIKEVFEEDGIGELQTVPGAAGGVKFVPRMRRQEALSLIEYFCNMLQNPERVLPGGYLYMSDLLGCPWLLRCIGKMFATAFADCRADVVMTVETKGIPIAYATAFWLDLPVVIVRRDNRVTEGSAVSMNYVSGSNRRIHTMSLARRALKEQAGVLIIDDFMRAGGTIRGMIDLLAEFRAHVCGVGVLVESGDVKEHLVDEYISLARLTGVDPKTKEVRVVPGNYFDREGVE